MIYKYQECSGLSNVTFPEGVTTIGDWAFYDCSGISSISIPEGVIELGRTAFHNTAWYNNQSDGLIYLGNFAYSYKGTMPANTEVVLEEGTKGICGRAFFNCDGLTSITIPNSVTMIGAEAFYGCRSLTSITIPNSVTKINGWTFYRCSNLASVNIPNTVTSIDGYAFYGCSNLASVNIPNSISSIGYSAFSGCTGLTSISIPESVSFIGDYAFSSCNNLTSITVDNSVPANIDSNTFYNINSSATLYVPYGSKAAYQAADFWKNFRRIIELEPLPTCATPVLTYQNGKIRCSCETEGVKYVYSITPTASTGESSDGVIELGTEFTVSVYATRDGYEDSEPATITIDLTSVGDMNGDGIISIADVTGLVNVILGK